MKRFGQNVPGRGFKVIKIHFLLSISIAISSWSSLRKQTQIKIDFLLLWGTVFSVSLLFLIIKVSYKDLFDLTGSFFYYLKQVPAASFLLFCPIVLANLHKFENKTRWNYIIIVTSGFFKSLIPFAKPFPQMFYSLATLRSDYEKLRFRFCILIDQSCKHVKFHHHLHQ